MRTGLVLWGLVWLVGACSGGDGRSPASPPAPDVDSGSVVDSDTGEATDTAPPPPLPSDPPWFEELPETRDADALAGVSFAPVDVSDPRFVVSDRVVSLRLADDGTREGFDALLATETLRVISSAPNVPVVFLERDAPWTTRDELDQLLARLEADPSVQHAWYEPEPQVATLPPGVDESTRPLVDAALAATTHRLWALRELTGQALQNGVMAGGPALVTIDSFGGGIPAPSLFEGVFDGADFAGDPQGPGEPHGYQVLSVLLPRWTIDQASPFGADVEGLAGPLTHPYVVRAFDVEGSGLVFAHALDAARLPLQLDQDVVITQSVLHGCPDPSCEQVLTEKAQALRDTLERLGTADRVLYVVAAGNVEPASPAPPGLEGAEWASVVARAGLPNALVVESSVHQVTDAASSRPTDPFFEHCVAASSNAGGDVSAPGVDVPVFDQTGTPQVRSGTSVAAPRVAGAAVVLWQHAPALTAAEVAERLRSSARPFASLRTATSPACADPATAAPLLDSHQAVLAADLGVPSAPVRQFLLDVDGNGQFDRDDLAAFLDHYTANDNVALFDAFDLNGDGRLGRQTRAPFDLDGPFQAAGSPLTYGLAPSEHVDPDGNVVYPSYDELAVSDLDVLCYYAYSPLFHAPHADDRDRILYEDYRDEGYTCPGVVPEVVAPGAACPMSTLDGDPFALAIEFGPHTAFPVEIRASWSGSGTIDPVPPILAPAVYVSAGARVLPKLVTASDPNLVVFGSVAASGGSLTVDFEFVQTDASGTEHLVTTESVTIEASPDADCEMPGPVPAGILKGGGGGWHSRRVDSTLDGYPGRSAVQYSIAESWVTNVTPSEWVWGSRNYRDGTIVESDSNGNLTIIATETIGRDSVVYDPVLNQTTRTTSSVSKQNGIVVASSGPTTTVTSCEGSFSCASKPSRPDQIPQCVAGKHLIAYDGDVYTWLEESFSGLAFSKGAGSYTCLGCVGPSSVGCTCSGGNRAQCP